MNPRYFIIAQNDLLAQELTGHVQGGAAAVAHEQGAHVDGVQAVHVLGGREGCADGLAVDVTGHGHHGKDAGDGRIVIQFADGGQDIVRRCCFRQFDAAVGGADAFGRLQETVAVDERGRVVTDGDDGEGHGDAFLFRGRDFGGDLRPVRVGDRFSCHADGFH